MNDRPSTANLTEKLYDLIIPLTKEHKCYNFNPERFLQIGALKNEIYQSQNGFCL